MTKDIYIDAHEGRVALIGFPQNFQKSVALRLAFDLINERHIEKDEVTIYGLSNVEYFVNPIACETTEQYDELKYEGEENLIYKPNYAGKTFTYDKYKARKKELGN